MAAVIRASSRVQGLRAAPARSAVVPRPASRVSFRQPAVVTRASTEGSTIDSEKLMKDLQAKYEAIENKPQFFLTVGAGLVGLWFSSVILSAVDHVPVIPKAFELVGLSYSAWFTYRYLLFKSSREELIKDVEALKDKISGSE